jgi:hypothetical protein
MGGGITNQPAHTTQQNQTNTERKQPWVNTENNQPGSKPNTGTSEECGTVSGATKPGHGYATPKQT